MNTFRSKLIRSAHIVVLVPMLFGVAGGVKAQTPPIQPQIQETPLPPPVELPPPPSQPVGVPNRPLSADEAAAIAIYNQPNIAVAQAGVKAAQGRVQQARAGLLPTISTGSSYTNTAITPTISGTGGAVSGVTANGYQVTAGLRQLLFDFNHTRDLVRQASALQTSADANLNRVRADLVLQVKQAFYAYSQAQRMVSVNETNVQSQQNHLALAQARLDSGFGLPADVVRAQTAVANAILNLTIARNNASIARVNLAQLLGIDPRTPIEAAETNEAAIAANDVNALVDLALKQRPEIKQVQSNVQAANYGVNAAKTSSSPAIAASSGWLQRGSNFPPDRNSLTYGVTVQWTPVDSGYTKGRVKEAEANLQANQAQAKAQVESVISDVSQAYLNMKTAEQRATTADSEVANAEEALRLTEGRYSSGLGTFLDVLDAQNALLTAKTNRVNAQSALNQARAAMTRAVGAPTNPVLSK